jgi:hypothetical protein
MSSAREEISIVGRSGRKARGWRKVGETVISHRLEK